MNCSFPHISMLPRVSASVSYSVNVAMLSLTGRIVTSDSNLKPRYTLARHHDMTLGNRRYRCPVRMRAGSLNDSDALGVRLTLRPCH
jgi:hypothetical protein